MSGYQTLTVCIIVYKRSKVDTEKPRFWMVCTSIVLLSSLDHFLLKIKYSKLNRSRWFTIQKPDWNVSRFWMKTLLECTTWGWLWTNFVIFHCRGATRGISKSTPTKSLAHRGGAAGRMLSAARGSAGRGRGAALSSLMSLARGASRGRPPVQMARGATRGAPTIRGAPTSRGGNVSVISFTYKLPEANNFTIGQI
jgi:hypothetical protein